MPIVPWPAITCGIVEGVHERESTLLLELERMVERLVVALAVQHDFSTTLTHCVDLQ